jgi:hypothetical protein
MSNTYPWPASGDIGIGTATPADNLEIYGGSSPAVIRLSNTSTGNNFIRAATSGNLELGTYYGHALGLFTSNGERLRIDGNGNVGVGTASPAAKLAINGGLHVGGDSDPGDNNAAIDGTLGVTGATTLTGFLTATGDALIGSGNKWLFLRNLAGVNRIDSYDNPITQTVPLAINAASISFSIADQLKLMIDSAGKVGIGTATPADNVEINGGASAAVLRLSNSSTSNDFVRAASSGNLELGTFYGHAVGLFTSNTERLRIDGTGNVGILSGLLTAAGDALIGSGDKRLYLRNLSGTNRIDSYDNPITQTVPLMINAASIAFNIADQPKVTLDSAGNLGIGTAPDAKLHVVGDTHLEGGQRVKVLVVTASLTLDATHYAVVANSASALTVTLPAASASAHSGRTYVVKNKGSGIASIAGTIDGNASGLSLAKNESVTLLSDGSEWLII